MVCHSTEPGLDDCWPGLAGWSVYRAVVVDSATKPLLDCCWETVDWNRASCGSLETAAPEGSLIEVKGREGERQREKGRIE